MADDTEAKQFGEALLKSMEDLARQIEVMGQRFTAIEARQRETPSGFQIGEGSGTSHHMQEHDATQHMESHAPTRSTMPTFLAADTRARAQQEPEPGHMGDTLLSIRPMGRSSGMPFHSEILFSSSGTADPVTITEGIGIITRETLSVR